MSHTKMLYDLTDDPGELVRLLADVAEVLREAHAAAAPSPNWCLSGCEPRRWFHWGPSLSCSSCGSRVMAASHWHKLLVTALCYAVTKHPWDQLDRAA